MSIEPTIGRSESQPEPRGYEPPRVEVQLTSEELEREILYAGEPPSAQA
jgi:hypothetical protein